ncbi:MAG: LLM class flavin-dependent oxidoreductase [Nitrososphaerota archaeon]
MVEFGVQLWLEEYDYHALRKNWRKVEELGYSSAWLYDHFYPMYAGSGFNILEPWTTLSILVNESSTLRLGIMVTCNSYRNPAILAKIAATVDVVSNGRLDFAIGAGWFKDEFDAYGIPFPNAKIRIEQLDEAVELIKSIWTSEKVYFNGKYYKVKGLVSYPKPIQKPYPPIWIGGSGSRLLRVTAKHADYANLNNLSIEECEEKLKLLEERCAEVNRNFNEIKKTWHGFAIIGNENEIREKASKFIKDTNIYKVKRSTVETFLRKIISGDVDECIEKIQKYADLGITYFIPHFLFDKDLKNAEIFAKEIIPSFK